VFYVQYAHARLCSVARQAQEVFTDLDLRPEALARAEFDLLDDAGERRIMRLVAQFPRIVEAAAEAREPHRVAFFAHELASALHAQWNRGKDDPRLRFVYEGARDLTLARQALGSVVASTLAGALGVLGVSAPREMR
jgi:arginyl-tRNA synthetase